MGLLKENPVKAPFGAGWLLGRVNQIEEELAPHRVPMRQRMDAASIKFTQVQHNINHQVKEAKKRKRQKRIEQREFIDASNLIPLGQTDLTGNIIKIMHLKHPGARGKIYDAQFSHENPPKTGYGKYRNLTWEQYEPIQKKAVERGINFLLESASEEDKLTRRTTFFHLMDQNDDTTT